MRAEGMRDEVRKAGVRIQNEEAENRFYSFFSSGS
jgi:hypothetical protein